MGKKSKKTRWRTLTLNGHQSDSEESSSKSGLPPSAKAYQHKYSKFPYSSQSTPIRKFQHESSKSTRSNSTTSEHKATFNEDEYTRITTPRQDVLFKKGYLNKPKSYQTQNSTGTSSTANSTSTCTPDHQSADGTEGTDLEYESQFVFPNGFIDQNGIYYINSYEPFPFVVYNAPICYPEYPTSRAKRYSTDSLTESVSPHNEEAAQECTQNGDRLNNTPVYSQTYMQPTGYYYTLTNGQYAAVEEPRRLKKRRRRKASRSKSNHEEDSDDTDDYASSDEVFSQSEGSTEAKRLTKSPRSSTTPSPDTRQSPAAPNHPPEQPSEIETEPEAPQQTPPQVQALEEPRDQITSPDQVDQDEASKPSASAAQNLLLQSLLKSSGEAEAEAKAEPEAAPTYSLKPDAEEFIPRTLRPPETPLPFDPNVQFLNLAPNFIPIPFVNHLGDLQRPPFLPPGIPLNFVPSQDPKLLPNFVNLVPNDEFVPKTFEAPDEAAADAQEVGVKLPEPPGDATANELEPPAAAQLKKTKNEIDIAKIVSKLEEAAQQQRFYETKRQSLARTTKYVGKPYANQRPRFNNRYNSDRYQKNRTEQPYERKFRRPKDDGRSEDAGETTPARSPNLREPRGPTTPSKHQSDQNVVNTVNTRLGESCSISKDLDAVNYSETLKKNKLEQAPAPSKSGPNNTLHKVARKLEAKPVEPASPKAPKVPNQWISVSSRKKRKNKPEQGSMDEPESEEPPSDDHLFESFDVNLLEDVVPPSKIQEPPVEDPKNNEIKPETPQQEPQQEPQQQQPHEEHDVQTLITIEQVEQVEKMLEASEAEPPPPPIPQDPTKLKKKCGDQKKKSKKGNALKLTKRVIITDELHLQVDLDQAKPPKTPPKTEPKQDDLKVELDDSSQPPEAKPSEPVALTSESDTTNETPEKKKKKKKKPPPKPALVKIPSASSSNTTLNALDDSYDFLLESAVVEDFDQKTNVEISQELDRIIQKGMYSSLEGKIKAMRIGGIDDGFFKTIKFGDGPNKAAAENSIIKAPSFGKILQDTAQLLKAPRDQESLINIDFSKIKLPDLEPQPSTSKSGLFPESLVNNGVGEAPAPSSRAKNNGKLKNKSKKNSPQPQPDDKGEEQNGTLEPNLTTSSHAFSYHQDEPLRKQDSLYPITQAVKDWMTKTRENTPDVEILKSPNTIYKEFHETETDSSPNETKNDLNHPRPSREASPIAQPTVVQPDAAPEATNDDEIILWSASAHNSHDEDILDAWEDQPTEAATIKNNLPNGLPPNKIGGIKEVKGLVHNGYHGHQNGHIEEGEEAIEIYESKYGKNEDFLKLKAEIEEQQKSPNFPKHGNLPYRAICCSIM